MQILRLECSLCSLFVKQGPMINAFGASSSAAGTSRNMIAMVSTDS